jgi:transposase-like protein
VAAAERSEDERSETERSGAVATAAINAEVVARPDPEVVAKAKRRKFTAAYKQQILAKADAVSEHGGIGALLRREGLYSSTLVSWRRERNVSVRQGLEPRKRGPKSKRNAFAEENQKLQRANDRLTEQLRKAELIIDVQKKVGTLLGWPIPDPEQER